MTDLRLPGAIQLPDGSWVRGRGLRQPRPPDTVPEYGLYLGSRKLRDRHDADLTWPHDWLDWPDFWLPRDRDRAVDLIVALHDQARGGVLVEVACAGGVGRTGTVLSCLVVLAGLPAPEAITWTRANHHRRAVETPWQRRWVTRFPVP